MMLKSLKLGAVVSKTGGEILGADMIYNYEQVLRQVTNKQTKRKKQNKQSYKQPKLIIFMKQVLHQVSNTITTTKHRKLWSSSVSRKNIPTISPPPGCIQQPKAGLLPQPAVQDHLLRAQRPLHLKWICTDGERYIVFAPVPATIWHKLDLVMLLTRGHGDTVFNKMFSSNFTNWAQLAKSTEIKSNSWNKYKYQNKYKYKW